MTIRTPHIVAACLSFLIGVGAASFMFAASLVPSWSFIAATVALAAFGAWGFSGRHQVITLIVVAAFGVGLLRALVIVQAPTDTTIIPDRAVVEVEGRVIETTSLRGGFVRLRLSGARMLPLRPRNTEAAVRLRRPLQILRPFGSDVARYGDTIRAVCRFTFPRDARDRLTTAGTCAVRRAGDLHIIATGGGSPTIRALLALQDVALRHFDRILTEPTAGVAAGMVLGVRRAVSDDLEAAFRRSGTIHLLVVSGWHMTFIALLIRKALGWVLAWFGISRRTAIKLTIAVVIAFTAMVGFTAPAVRGALVAIAIQSVDLLGRVGNPIRLLLLVATMMVAVHPHILGFDLAFQLTIAATAAILLVLPAVEHVLPYRRQLLRDGRDLVAASAAASLATAPLLAASLGTVAVFGSLVSTPILPLAAAVMVFGLALLAAAVILPLAIPAIAWALTTLTSAIVWAVEHIAAIPWATIPVGRPDAWFIAGGYCLALVAIVWWYQWAGIPIIMPCTSAAHAERSSVLQT